MRSRQSMRRLGLILGAGAVLVIVGTTLHGMLGNTGSLPVPSKAAPAAVPAATPTALSVRQRIVAIAESQVGYSTVPSNSYCNKFSAYWSSGMEDCPSGEKDEEWCADFAAWAWQKAGVPVAYGYGQGQINGAAVSFYQWGIANDEWHPVTSRYVAEPGDVAVYGLTPGAYPAAMHVAIVKDDAPGHRGPDVVNGDDDRTGYSVVETGTNQVHARSAHHDSTLSGFVSPP